MNELPESNVVSGMVPDVSWIEKFGAVFKWTPEQNKLANRQFDAAVKAKHVPPIEKKRSIFLILFVLLIVIGVMMSLVIAPTILRQPYQSDSSNILAGAVLGGSGIGVALLIYGWILGRFAKHDDVKWFYTTIRVGVENNVLWLFKHNTVYLFPSANAFVRVTRVEDFIIAYVAKAAAHFLPTKTLSETEEGRKVIAWFDTNWPENTASKFQTDPIPRIVRFKRFSRRAVMTLCVYGIAWLVILCAVYAGNWWQDKKNQEAISRRLSSDGAKFLTGPAAGKFLDNLAHPDAK